MFDTRGAACKKFDPTWWDGEPGSPTGIAITICTRCPLNTPENPVCLEWSLNNDEWGIWAGLTKPQRDKIRSGRKRVRCPECTANQVWTGETAQTCACCGLTWPVRRKTAEPLR